jgi:hypothetical protein
MLLLSGLLLSRLLSPTLLLLLPRHVFELSMKNISRAYTVFTCG